MQVRVTGECVHRLRSFHWTRTRRSWPKRLRHLMRSLKNCQAASSRRGFSLRTPGTTKAQALLPPSDTIPEYPGYALQGHCSGVQEVVVIKGRFVISASDDYDIRIWDFGSKKQEHFPEHVHVGRKSNC